MSSSSQHRSPVTPAAPPSPRGSGTVPGAPAASAEQGTRGVEHGAEAWSDRELSLNPHAREDKPERVRRMFAAIARSYDLNNRLHSMWRDQAWRKFAVRASGVKAHERVLDVACGTGDLSEWFARAGAREVVGVDFTSEMLDIARDKAARRSGAWHCERIRYAQGDAQRLGFEDASFDVVSIAFGIRNVLEPVRALGEFRRVLRPGGRLIVLEFAEPSLGPVRWFNRVYCQRIMPVTATLISGDRSGAYKYLPRSVSTFLTPDELSSAMVSAGFEPGVKRWAMSLGICVCYRAEVRGLAG